MEIKSISVVVPMYNEEEMVEKCYEAVRQVMETTLYPWEFVAVDDGSTDQTLPILKRLARSSKNFVALHQTHRGMGAAIQFGFQKAKGTAMVTLDADLSFGPHYIPVLLERLRSADVVIGSPFANGAQLRNVPVLRRWGSRFFNYLDRLVLKIPVRSTSSLLRAYRREAILSIAIDSASFDAQTEIIAKLCRKGFNIAEIPCDLVWEKKGRRKSRMRPFREVARRIKLWRTI